MKHMLLIGKLNETVKTLNRTFTEHFAVQLCSDSLQLLQGIMKISRPDIIVISAVDLEQSHADIFDFLNQRYGHIPMLCIGSGEELNIFHQWMAGDTRQEIKRPISTSDIVAAVYRMLGISIKEETDSVYEQPIQKKKTILLVDDAAIQLRAMKGMLNQEYCVKMATSGMEALKIIQKNPPDLILLDYDMPGCDGKETFENIRREENGKTVPIVFVTGVAERDRIMAVVGLKPAGYLVKPVESEKLLEIVHQVLESRMEIQCET